MGLAESQRLLARLYTDAELRARFADDPRAFGAEFGLDNEESNQLAQLTLDQVDRFAGSLWEKRRLDVGKLVPVTLGVLGDARFATLFREHATSFVPNGHARILADAREFVRFVLAHESVTPAWRGDALRYESAWLRAIDPSRRWTFVRLRHAPSDLAASLDTGRTPPVRLTLALWFRASREGTLRHVVMSLPRWSRQSM